jgi:predicted DNA-binding protein with PD1-like motif
MRRSNKPNMAPSVQRQLFGGHSVKRCRFQLLEVVVASGKSCRFRYGLGKNMLIVSESGCETRIGGREFQSILDMKVMEIHIFTVKEAVA